jgi:hypothetical protein
MYRYTHQLFLSDNSLCAILFNLMGEEMSVHSQLCFWMESVLQRAPQATCILIGTHCQSIDVTLSNERLKTQLALLDRVYPSRVSAAYLIDSLTDYGTDSLLEGLNFCADVIQKVRYVHHLILKNDGFCDFLPLRRSINYP